MVKKYFLIVVAILMGSLTEVEAMMAPIVDTKPDVRVIRRTPCHDEFQQSLENGTLVPSIVLTKEGSVLSVELCNYVCDCEVEEFQVESYVSEACVDPPNLIINVEPASTYNADCKCPCNLSFTVNDVDLNIYELTCWWFDGIVELTDGVPLVLLKDHEVPTIMGDVNGDGNVNSADVQKIYQLMATGATGTTNPEADLNKDSNINSADIQLLYSIMAGNQSHYTPMFCDGRSWKYEYSVPDYSSMTEEQIMNGDYSSCGRLTYSYELRVEGDVMFDGRQCKKIVYDGFNGTGLFAYGYEANGIVMIYVLEFEPAFYTPYPTEQWLTLYDFKVTKGSYCHLGAFWGTYMVVNDGSVKVRGVDRHYLGLGDAQNPTRTLHFAVEGIGCAFGLYEFENLNTNGSSSRFVGCYDGENCIFSAEDFKALAGQSNAGSDPVVDYTKEKCWTMEYTSPYYLSTKYISTVLRGDTIINDIHFRKLWTKEWNEGEEEPQEWNASNSYIGQDGDKIYRYWHPNSVATEPYLILDFSARTGDEMTIECGESLNFRVTAVTDTILTSSSDRTRRKCIYLECTDDSFANDVWVEGIGSLRFGIEGNLALAVGSKATLIKCTSDEEVLYLNPNQEWDHEYVPFVEEGKVWYCKDGQITPEDPWGSDIDCIFTIQGDTLIGENIYKKVFCQYENYYGDKDQHYYCAVREESYQVFLVEEEANEEILLYDFSQPRKTIAFERNKLRFARCAGDHIDEIIWQTHQYDFWLAAYNANGEIDYTSGYGSWTEGAGYTHGNPFALEFSYMFGPHSKLGPLGVVTCMKGEKLLFSEEWLWIMVGAK